MNKVLNTVDALDGLVEDEHLNELSRIARLYLKPIIGGPDGDGHGHDEIERDRDQELEAAVSDVEARAASEQASSAHAVAELAEHNGSGYPRSLLCGKH